MTKNSILIGLLALSSLTFAQNKTAIKYANTITVNDAYKHLSVLASDKFEGRETGKAGAQMAADYIKLQFKTLGLKAPVKNDYFQYLDLNEKTLAQKNVIVNGKSMSFLNDFYVLPRNFKNTTKTFIDFIFIGYGISNPKYDDLSGLNLEGKVAVVLNGEPMLNGKYLLTGTSKPSEWSNRTFKIETIKAKKPAAIIYLCYDIEKRRANKTFFDKTSMFLGDADEPLVFFFSQDAFENLMSSTGKKVDSLKSLINNTLKPASFSFSANLDVDVQNSVKPLIAKNVLGFMEGSDAKLKKEILVITAHYDHLGIGQDGDVFNGADDDASGTAGVLEIAEAFAKAKKEGKGPKRSILFMTVVGEEKGLLGSAWYSDHPVFPLVNTITNLNIDMIGRTGELYKSKLDSENYIYVIGSDKLSSTLRTINEKMNSTYTHLKLDYLYDDPADPSRIYYRSDHYNFAKHGIPIIFYFNGIHEDYHKKSDEISKINFPLLVKRAQLVFYTAWELANRAEKPKVDHFED